MVLEFVDCRDFGGICRMERITYSARLSSVKDKGFVRVFVECRNFDFVCVCRV